MRVKKIRVKKIKTKQTKVGFFSNQKMQNIVKNIQQNKKAADQKEYKSTAKQT